jgi:hypothetical protein
MNRYELADMDAKEFQDLYKIFSIEKAYRMLCEENEIEPMNSLERGFIEERDRVSGLKEYRKRTEATILQGQAAMALWEGLTL